MCPLQYDSLEQGINAAVSIYVEVLLGLARTHGFEIFVHPPAPVLKETRHIVIPFQAALKERIQSLPRADQQLSLPHAALSGDDRQEDQRCETGAGKIHYLDFFEDLLVKSPLTASQILTGTGLQSLVQGNPQLRPDLEFDGTHMAPTYIGLLNSVLCAVV